MVRGFAIALTLLGALLAAGLVVEDPGILGSVWAKLTEGGMWTALGAFIAAAGVLAYRRRGGAPPRRR